MTPEECLVIYGEAWFERDPSRRVEVLRRCCTEDIVFMDPRLGRLHGLDNVYVAGAAVFPSEGSWNPTLTMTAMARRLAAHLMPR